MTETLNVVVPAERVARAVDAAAELAAVLVPFGGPSLSEPERRPGDAVIRVPPHDPPARALVVDNHRWDEIAGILDQVPSIELIQTLTGGVEYLRGAPGHIVVANARGAHGAATAEFAMTLLLALRRRVPEIVRAQERAHWLSPPPFAGSLVGEHILVLGAGEVAREFQRRAEAFAASVALVGRTARPGVYPVAELPDLLPRYGVVVVAVSANSSTRHLVNAEFLAAMPDGASLVNVARGWVVDTEALIAELTAGRLTAALDVTDPEPLGADHPLWRTPGVLIAPHTAAATSGVADRAVGVAVAQLRQFAQGRIPDNAVPRSDLA